MIRTFVGLLMIVAGAVPARAGRPPLPEWTRSYEVSGPGLPIRMQVAHHRNGLTLVVVPMKTPGVTAYGSLVRVGARNEVEKGHTGFAHFFEHMMFRGTKLYPPSRYKAVLQQAGSDDNAYTSNDRTFYYIVGRSDMLEKIAEIEADRFQNLSYGRTVFQTEARAVLGEYRKSMASPRRRVWEKLLRTAFTRHTYSHSALGFLPDIKVMPRRYGYSLKFFRRYYTPDNIVLIVAGDVEASKVKKTVHIRYGRWKGRVYRPKIPKEPLQRKLRTAHVPWKGRTVPRLVMAYKVPAFLASANDSAALSVIAEMTFGKASRLYRKLVLERRLVSALSAWVSPHRDPHLFVAFFEVRDKAKIPEVKKATEAALKRLAAGKVPEGVGNPGGYYLRKVTAVRSHVKYSLLMQLDTPKRVLFQLASMASSRGRVQDLPEFLKQLEGVRPADVFRAAGKYLTRKSGTYVTVHRGPAVKEAAR